MAADRWLDYDGPLCDDPAERSAWSYVEPPEPVAEPLWEELDPDERWQLKHGVAPPGGAR